MHRDFGIAVEWALEGHICFSSGTLLLQNLFKFYILKSGHFGRLKGAAVSFRVGWSTAWRQLSPVLALEPPTVIIPLTDCLADEPCVN